MSATIKFLLRRSVHLSEILLSLSKYELFLRYCKMIEVDLPVCCIDAMTTFETASL